jgi:hypothetical protein
MNDLVKSYLVHYGYVETLQSIEEPAQIMTTCDAVMEEE